MPTKRKKRVAVRVPSYRKHKATGLAVVTLNGKDQYLGRHGTKASRAEYERLIAEWMAGARTVPAADKTEGPTIAEMLAGYWVYLQQRYTGHTREQLLDHHRHALRPLARLYADTLVADFGPRGLKAVRADMIEAGLARSEVNRRIAMLRRAFRWAVAEEVAPADLAHRLNAIEHLRRGEQEVREGRKIRPVADEHIEPILEHLSPQVVAMVQLQRLTGMRSGEIVQVRPCDIDRSKKPWRYCPRHHKTEHHGKERVVLFGPRARGVLQPFLDRVPLPGPEQAVFRPDQAEEHRQRRRRIFRRTPMTPSQRLRKRKPKSQRQRAPRNTYDTHSYRRAIQRAIEIENAGRLRAAVLDAIVPFLDEQQHQEMKRALARLRASRVAKMLVDTVALIAAGFGAVPTSQWLKAVEQAAKDCPIIPNWHPHQLRHSAATRIRREYGLDAARACLGHSGLGITNDYAELDADKAGSVMEEAG